eukprot:scaffold33863_cov57-Phaeocystis_antarctica.AAC.3
MAPVASTSARACLGVRGRGRSRIRVRLRARLRVRVGVRARRARVEGGVRSEDALTIAVDVDEEDLGAPVVSAAGDGLRTHAGEQRVTTPSRVDTGVVCDV